MRTSECHCRLRAIAPRAGLTLHFCPWNKPGCGLAGAQWLLWPIATCDPVVLPPSAPAQLETRGIGRGLSSSDPAGQRTPRISNPGFAVQASWPSRSGRPRESAPGAAPCQPPHRGHQQAGRTRTAWTRSDHWAFMGHSISKIWRQLQSDDACGKKYLSCVGP